MTQLSRSALVVISAIALVALAPTASADQDSLTRKSDPSAASASAPGSDRLTPSQLEDLLGPIALYPDALLANVLAASVYPNEVAEAAAAVKSGATADQIDAKSWESPVKAVAQVPDAMKMLGDYPDWTVALGQAYLVQAKDVMDVVQSLRKKAQANGALQTTPQQKVVVQQDIIYVQSADPEIVYVPSYQPSVVYVEDNSNAVAAGVIGFGAGVATGLLLSNMDCDYHYGHVSYGYGGNSYNNVNINTGNINTGNINRGNVNTGNINSGNINAGSSYGPRPGQEGNAWKPNQSKPIASQQPGRYQSAANTAAAAGKYPASTAKGTASTRPATGATGAAARQTPASRPATGGGVPANRPPSAVQSNRGGGTNSARPSSGGNSAGSQSMNRPSSGSQRSSSGSAFSGGSGSRSASQRGSQSRGGGGQRASPSRGGGGGGRR